MLARLGRGGSSGSSDEDEYDSEGAEDRGLSTGSSGMQCDVVAILRGSRGRDMMIEEVWKRRSMYKYTYRGMGNCYRIESNDIDECVGWLIVSG